MESKQVNDATRSKLSSIELEKTNSHDKSSTYNHQVDKQDKTFNNLQSNLFKMDTEQSSSKESQEDVIEKYSKNLNEKKNLKKQFKSSFKNLKFKKCINKTIDSDDDFSMKKKISGPFLLKKKMIPKKLKTNKKDKTKENTNFQSCEFKFINCCFKNYFS